MPCGSAVLFVAWVCQSVVPDNPPLLTDHRYSFVGVNLTASVRFLLACIQVKESAPFYHRYIAKNDLFKRMFACFFATSADDMLKASICNLIDVIATLNCKVLVKYIAKQYGERLRV